MNLKPSPEFLEACRRVSGIDDDSPGHIIPLLRGPLALAIQMEHARIVDAKEESQVTGG